jgi:hypothetical protein
VGGNPKMGEVPVAVLDKIGSLIANSASKLGNSLFGFRAMLTQSAIIKNKLRDSLLITISKIMRLKFNWFWGCVGFLGVLGYILDEPLWYVFFVFFIFFLEPAIKKSKK